MGWWEALSARLEEVISDQCPLAGCWGYCRRWGLHQLADLSLQPPPSLPEDSGGWAWSPERATIPANVEFTLEFRRAGSSPQTSDHLSALQPRPAGAGGCHCPMAVTCRVAIFLSRALALLYRQRDTWLLGMQLAWHIWLCVQSQRYKDIGAWTHEIQNTRCSQLWNCDWLCMVSIFRYLQGLHTCRKFENKQKKSLKNGQNPLMWHLLAK